MRIPSFFIAGTVFAGSVLSAAEPDLQNLISTAAAKLADTSGFEWQSVVKAPEARGPGAGGGGTTSGRFEKGGYTYVVSESNGGLEFASKGFVV